MQVGFKMFLGINVDTRWISDTCGGTPFPSRTAAQSRVPVCWLSSRWLCVRGLALAAQLTALLTHGLPTRTPSREHILRTTPPARGHRSSRRG